MNKSMDSPGRCDWCLGMSNGLTKESDGRDICPECKEPQAPPMTKYERMEIVFATGFAMTLILGWAFCMFVMR